MKKFLLLPFFCLAFFLPALSSLADVTLSPASGGTGISADTVGGVFAALTGPELDEGNSGEILPGDIILNAPAGFIFNTNSVVTVLVSGTGTGSDIALISGTADVTTNTITITVDTPSDTTRLSTLLWTGIQVQPTAGTPLADDVITETGSAIFTLVSLPPEEYGALTEVHGAAHALVFAQQPVSERAGHIFTQQPVVQAIDVFSNVLTDLPAGSVTISLTSGTGRMFGQTALDIGASAGAGVAVFTNLEINTGGNKQLTASYTGLSSVAGTTFTNAGTATRYTLAGNYATGNSPHGITLADFRGVSSWRDMAVANTGDGTATVRFCNDDGTFASTSGTYTAGLAPVAPVYLDTDLDGKDEFVVANSGTNTVTVFKNTSHGIFGTNRSYAISTSPNAGPVFVAVADLNHDGRMDIITANYNEGTVGILFGAPGGTFTNLTNYTVGNTPSSVYVTDVNQDGHLDIVTANRMDGSVSVLLGTSVGTFVPTLDTTLFAGGAPQPVRVLVSDMNRDGSPDLVTLNYASNTISIFTNNGSGAFSFYTNYETGTHPTDVLFRDLDADGYNDLVVANSGSGTISVLMQKTNGTFAAAETVAAGGNSSAVAGSNFNGDGLSDLAVVDTDDNDVSVFLYTGPVPVSSTASVAENRTSTITLSARSLLPEVFSYQVTINPLHGTLTPTATPNKFDYTPAANFVGADALYFTASDGSITSRVGVVAITVRLVNAAPFFNLSTNSVTRAEDAGAQTILSFATNLNRGQLTESNQTLGFVVTNSNHALFVTQPAISSVGTLTFRTATNAFGSAVVGAYIDDNGGTNSGGTNKSAVQTFTITVTPVNDPPRITTIANHSMLENAVLSFALPVTDVDTPLSNLLFTVGSSNPSLLAGTNIVPSFNGTNWILTLTPATNSSGTAVVSLLADDQSGGTASNHFTLTVTAVNHVPTFTLPTNSLAVIGDTGLQTNVHFATNILAGPTNEHAQAMSFVLAGVNTALYATQPVINAKGDLVFAPKTLAVGTNVISVRLKDNGNNLNGGTNESPAQTFTVAITTNNFWHLNGIYNGLFYDSPVQEVSAGLLSFTLATSRAFSGSIAIDGGKYTIPGQKFDASGAASFSVPRTGKLTLTVNLQLDLTNGTDQVIGTVSDGIWTVPVLGDRAVTNVTVPAPGAYTIAFTGTGDGVTSPAGDGIGDVKVATNGAVTLSGGVLADTAVISQSTYLSKNQQWPFYASLYGGQGSVIGWITFTNDVASDIDGSLTWIKPSSASAYYPNGFTNTLTLIGSTFSIVPGTPALAASSGSVYLTGPTLPTLTNGYIINTNSVLTVATNSIHLSLSLLKPSGFISGLFSTPQTGNFTQVKGVLLQKENRARGFFYTTHESGDFLMQ